MGVVHLARRGDGRRPGRAQGAAPAHRRRRRGARPAGARGVVAEPDPQPVGRRDRRRRPVGARALRRHPLRPRPLAARPRARGGADRRPGPHLVRGLPRRGRRVGARGRRAAPRREAVQRADGGPHPDPHRLRPGPGRRRPQAHPHRLAARHAGLPRARDPVRRRRHHRLRRALVGGDRRLRRHRPPALRPRPVDGDHGPGPPRRARPVRHPRPAARSCSAEALDPEPHHRPTLPRSGDRWLRAPALAAATACAAAAGAG